MKTLREVEIGGTATVKKFHGEGAIKKRIMDMGINLSIFYRTCSDHYFWYNVKEDKDVLGRARTLRYGASRLSYAYSG